MNKDMKALLIVLLMFSMNTQGYEALVEHTHHGDLVVEFTAKNELIFTNTGSNMYKCSLHQPPFANNPQSPVTKQGDIGGRLPNFHTRTFYMDSGQTRHIKPSELGFLYTCVPLNQP